MPTIITSTHETSRSTKVPALRVCGYSGACA